MWKRASPGLPSVSAAPATERGSPESMIARRISASEIPVAPAIASSMTPANAPCRSSPKRSRRRKSASPGVAPARSAPRIFRRSAAEPAPDEEASRSKAASTSSSVRLGADARALESLAELCGADAEARLAQPSGEERDRGLDLRGLEPAEEHSQDRGFLRPRPRRRDPGRCSRQLLEQHGRALALEGFPAGCRRER